jgi:hypothetical protein
VIALDEEIGGPITIDALSWHRSSVGGESASFSNFKIYLGHGASDVLGTTFDDNYIVGTKVLVYENAAVTLTAAAEEWVTLDLDTAFDYNGTDNLIMEIQWSGGSGTFYTYKWQTGTNRCLTASNPSLPTGSLTTQMCQLRLDLPLALENMTFAAIKKAFI